jgi:hypothetical protein
LVESKTRYTCNNSGVTASLGPQTDDRRLTIKIS